ncbi:ParA family protein [Geoalkalibacter subterraneus]|uniref:AAA domain-containing protein n=1 Tax=Geoalkalibacter subterraneus TaxID=483547 RepID=A0A0B5FX54_9BACT|nr:ParA family protein [Geoalkalibacter subterraneus]AJF08181.1 hypothetical protein GSUB_16940 [Geoalkalibacter subterraneus]
MDIVAIASQKGGVAKTTTALALSAGLANLGHRVLGVDVDPQYNFSLGAAVPTDDVGQSLFSVFVDNKALSEIIVSSPQGFDVARSLPAMYQTERALAGKMMIELKLAKALKSVQEQYDFCIIDCPPALDLLTTNALLAATHVIIPAQLHSFGAAGVVQIFDMLDRIEPETGIPAPKILGVLPTFYDARKNLSKDLLAELRKFYKSQVFDAVVPTSAPLEATASVGRSIYQFAPSSSGARAYKRVCLETLARLEGRYK